MEALQSDFKDIQAKAKTMGPHTSLAEIVRFVKSDLVPFIESHIGETAEIDIELAAVVQQSDDSIQPETAAVFAGVIIGGRTMAVKLLELAPKAPDGKLIDVDLQRTIDAFVPLAAEAEALLEDITVSDDDEDDEDGEGEDGEDEEGDEDEEGKEATP